MQNLTEGHCGSARSLITIWTFQNDPKAFTKVPYSKLFFSFCFFHRYLFIGTFTKKVKPDRSSLVFVTENCGIHREKNCTWKMLTFYWLWSVDVYLKYSDGHIVSDIRYIVSILIFRISYRYFDIISEACTNPMKFLSPEFPSSWVLHVVFSVSLRKRALVSIVQIFNSAAEVTLFSFTNCCDFQNQPLWKALFFQTPLYAPVWTALFSKLLWIDSPFCSSAWCGKNVEKLEKKRLIDLLST